MWAFLKYYFSCFPEIKKKKTMINILIKKKTNSFFYMRDKTEM